MKKTKIDWCDSTWNPKKQPRGGMGRTADTRISVGGRSVLMAKSAACTLELACKVLAPILGAEYELEYRFAPPRRWRFDAAFPAVKIAIEVEGGAFTGGRHFRGVGAIKDMEKYNTATKRGWRLFRFTPQMVADGEMVEFFAECGGSDD
ncbi:hypothetical protein FACS1894216_00910 [Synergistales bacterium]|nr:hypothetical protein FACS1894216_00910 [Synergistales bacterium]